MVEGQGARCSILGPAGATAAIWGGMMVPGQTVAQSGEQFAAQQSLSPCAPAIPSWPSAMLEEWDLGQAGEGTARAGPDAIASERLSQIKARMRRMALTGISELPSRGNVLHH